MWKNNEEIKLGCQEKGWISEKVFRSNQRVMMVINKMGSAKKAEARRTRGTLKIMYYVLYTRNVCRYSTVSLQKKPVVDKCR